jgi:hypothetical protein
MKEETESGARFWGWFLVAGSGTRSGWRAARDPVANQKPAPETSPRNGSSSRDLT